MVRRLAGGLLAAIVATSLAVGCSKKQEEDKPFWAKKPAPCKTDKNCADGFICEKDTCVEGTRSPEELARRQAAKRAKREEARRKKETTKPGEGVLMVRICPGFKHTPNSIGTLVATHQETRKEHRLHLAHVVPEGEWHSEFKFPSLPLGKYDIKANYGILNPSGRAEVVFLKCHRKAKPCRDENIREMEPVLPEKLPPPKLNKKGQPKLKPCDFVAE